MLRLAITFLAVVRYKIWIHTGAVDSAEPDSDAHIYLCLYGERGDTGKRVISFMESDHKEKFQEGQVIFKKANTSDNNNCINQWQIQDFSVRGAKLSFGQNFPKKLHEN